MQSEAVVAEHFCCCYYYFHQKAEEVVLRSDFHHRHLLAKRLHCFGFVELEVEEPTLVGYYYYS